MQETRRVRRLVVGLGNPGSEYEATRHNVGFDVLDHLARHEGLFFESPAVLEDWSGTREAEVALMHDPPDIDRALLVKPRNFMNRSGAVVAPLVRWAGVEPADCLVVYDDMDLPVSALRIRPFGGTGGHNGMRSITESLGSDRFPRLRVGIGRPGTDAARHVLARFDKRERREVDVSVAEAVDAILFWLEDGDIDECMTRFHSRWNQGS